MHPGLLLQVFAKHFPSALQVLDAGYPFEEQSARWAHGTQRPETQILPVALHSLVDAQAGAPASLGPGPVSLGPGPVSPELTQILSSV